MQQSRCDVVVCPCVCVCVFAVCARVLVGIRGMVVGGCVVVATAVVGAAHTHKRTFIDV